jgi:cystathionine gamma-synthase
MEFETLSIHAGQEPDPNTGAVMTPIYQTSTYRLGGVGHPVEYEYSRTGNPTRNALEKCLAALEGGAYGLAFSSGMAATDTVVRLLEPGDHVLVGDDVYGGTFRLFTREYERYGLAVSYVDTTDLSMVRAALRPETRLVWVETPSNPYLNITDLTGLAEVLAATTHRPLLAVDNTFATPYLQRPLDLGADLVMHSTTKYLGGHSDVIGGALVVMDAGVHERLSFLQNAVGAVPGPMDCFLVLRGIKTLPVRMDRHARNAAAVAEYLAGQARVKQVLYPTHPSHPQAPVAARQMRKGGGMISFTLDGALETAIRLVEATRVFTLAESLGGVESLIELPAAMTHLSTADSPLAVDPGLIRLSVGLEHVDDLIRDLAQAIEIAYSQ